MSCKSYALNRFDTEYFLSRFWQKKPCLIRQFVSNFVDPIDQHDLAGLAQEEQVDSRMVSYEDGTWQVSNGPFTDYTDICKGAWSLLVQGVDKYIDEVDALTQLVDFIPYWRLDDVMVSFSNINAGVGSHIDEYDVFILQGKGSRRWQVGLPGAYNTKLPHPLLKQITGFEALIDEVLHPGDAIYIPPKHPHNGIALEDCLNYSIGFRAPTDVELLNNLLDDEELNKLAKRYQDKDINALRKGCQRPDVVSKHELARLKAMLADLLVSEKIDASILKCLSTQHLPNSQESLAFYSIDELQGLCSEGAIAWRMPAVRPLFDENSFYIDGRQFKIAPEDTEFMKELLTAPHINLGLINEQERWSHACKEQVLSLLNLGYWQLNPD